MHEFITSHDQWLIEYRKDKYKIWTKVKASNGTDYYLPEHKDWLRFKSFCLDNNLKVTSISLQYRSHSVEVDTMGCDGVYLVRSLIGRMGEQTKHAITIGKVQGDKVKKTMWITPELIEELNDEDPIENCFEEALIIYGKESK